MFRTDVAERLKELYAPQAWVICERAQRGRAHYRAWCRDVAEREGMRCVVILSVSFVCLFVKLLHCKFYQAVENAYELCALIWCAKRLRLNPPENSAKYN